MVARGCESAVSFAIIGGNDNGGQPAFGIGLYSGVLFVASEHSYETTPLFYRLLIAFTDDGTAPYGAANITVTGYLNATMLNVNERPRFITYPNDSVTLNGVWRAEAL
jgi:hypothetical protein